ncbi:Alpha-amylase type B isozyme [Nymphaea thermarum]|nr:Alpha-amylase type B isozyme [Nymphaea thermarum]
MGGAATAFDFTTKGVLQSAINNELWRLKDRQGRPSRLIGISLEKAVTFIDNHVKSIGLFLRTRSWKAMQSTGLSLEALSRYWLVADKDLYVAKIDGKVITKIGSRFDAGGLIPPGFHMVTSGKDYAVWEMKPLESFVTI